MALYERTPSVRRLDWRLEHRRFEDSAHNCLWRGKLTSSDHADDREGRDQIVGEHCEVKGILIKLSDVRPIGTINSVLRITAGLRSRLDRSKGGSAMAKSLFIDVFGTVKEQWDNYLLVESGLLFVSVLDRELCSRKTAAKK